MSLRPQPWPEPSGEITRAVLAIYAGRRAAMPIAVRDESGELFADEQFVSAFADRGPEGWSPGRLMLVTVLQAAEGLTDRQAAEAVRDKLSWKYALGLELTDPGFDASILSQFRTRLVAHELQTRVLDLLVARLVEAGLLKAGGKQRTDSTHVLAAVRLLNQVELVGESVRACLESIAAADPDWVATVLDTSWQRRYAARIDSWRMPSSKTKRVALGNDFARDGHALLHAVWHPASPGWLRELPAVDVLRRVLVQHTKVTADRSGREVITLRDADTDGLPPGRSRIVSPVRRRCPLGRQARPDLVRLQATRVRVLRRRPADLPGRRQRRGTRAATEPDHERRHHRRIRARQRDDRTDPPRHGRA